jgi:hypothetical protein
MAHTEALESWNGIDSMKWNAIEIIENTAPIKNGNGSYFIR